MRSAACSDCVRRRVACRRASWAAWSQTTTQTASQRATRPPSISRIASSTTTGAVELATRRLDGLPHAGVEDALRGRLQRGPVGHTRCRPTGAGRSSRRRPADAAPKRAAMACGFGRPRGVQRVHQAVRVDVVGAVLLGQQLADRALAAGDIAGQSQKKSHDRAVCYIHTRARCTSSPPPTTPSSSSRRARLRSCARPGKIVAATIRALEEKAAAR